jgi:hypothetical protein
MIRHALLAATITLASAVGAHAADTTRPKDERDQVTRYHAYHVLTQTEDAAKKAHARILAAIKGHKDRTLSALKVAAREMSIDSGTATQGGDLGRVLEGTFDERFEHSVLALEPGTLSAPFAAEYGWHVVYLAEKRAIPVSLVCGPRQGLESADVARVTIELGPSWRGPAADFSGIVSFLRASPSTRGAGFRDVTLHRELPHAVLVPAREPPACYRSARIRFTADCGRQRLAIQGSDYFDARAAGGTMVESIEDKQSLEDADFEAVPARGGARQIYDAACDSEPEAW